jgi:hypothetical protein
LDGNAAMAQALHAAAADKMLMLATMQQQQGFGGSPPDAPTGERD